MAKGEKPGEKSLQPQPQPFKLSIPNSIIDPTIDDDVELVDIKENSGEVGSNNILQNAPFPTRQKFSNQQICERLQPDTDFTGEQLEMIGIDIDKAMTEGDIFQRKPNVYRRL